MENRSCPLHSLSLVAQYCRGVHNFSATWLLLLATKFALPLEKGVVFPCFAVGTMVLCNVWAKKLYKEPFIVQTHFLCSLGLFIAAP